LHDEGVSFIEEMSNTARLPCSFLDPQYNLI
jgi:hypothetical protein